MRKKKSLAILGANGLIGSDLVNYLSDRFEIYPITRENYHSYKGKEFDIFLNANGNSRRFWALQNIYKSFEKTVISTYKTIFDFKFKKYIYISSSDVYADHKSPKTTLESSAIDSSELNTYGFNKYLSEQIIRNNLRDFIILRLSMVLGKKLKKGPIFDIINKNPLLIASDSKLQAITTRAISEVVESLISQEIKNEIYNVGGIGVVNFRNIGKYFDTPIKYSEEVVRQCYEMSVSKIAKKYTLKSSEDYLKEWISEQ